MRQKLKGMMFPHRRAHQAKPPEQNGGRSCRLNSDVAAACAELYMPCNPLMAFERNGHATVLDDSLDPLQNENKMDDQV